jgi:hypothetical protein
LRCLIGVVSTIESNASSLFRLDKTSVSSPTGPYSSGFCIGAASSRRRTLASPPTCLTDVSGFVLVEVSARRGHVVPRAGAAGCSHILGDPVASPYGPNLQAVAACLNAGDFVSIEFGIARKYPSRPRIAL